MARRIRSRSFFGHACAFQLIKVKRVQMDSGLNSINFTTRKMAAKQNKLSYNIYTNALRSKVWGDGTAGTFTLTGSRLTVYASIPAGQVIALGTYNDTVVVTIVW